MIKEFRTFIMRGNVIDLAVGIIIGAAFTAIVNSLVNDLINPFIGLLLGGTDLSNIFIVLRDGVPPGPYQTLEAAVAAGAVTVNIGSFINAVINFLIIALVVFLLIRAINRAMTLGRKKAEEEAAAPDPLLVAQQELKASIDKLTETMERKA
jgi:large conductance mechanosensitive channel